MNELTLVSALFIGLLGSSHCLVMCGGLSSALGLGDDRSKRFYLLSYNLGRLFTYAAIGAVAGILGEQIIKSLPAAGIVLRTMAGLLLVAMGLYVSQLWMGLTRLEQVGAHLWKRIQPLTKSLLPVNSHRKATSLGMLWGLLPCGLVYSTLSWALASADWQQSALLMFAFGMGTLPAMLSLGLLNQQLLLILRGRRFRVLAGVLIIVMGLITMLTPRMHQGAGHDHHQPASDQQGSHESMEMNHQH